MQPLHASLGPIVGVAALVFAIVAGISAWLDRWHGLVRRLSLALGALLVLQVVLGVVVFLTGSRPSEGLHVLYGIVVLAVLPLASSFAAEAPPRPYSGVLAVGGLVVLLLAWRLLATG
jgi:heme A synthase